MSNHSPLLEIEFHENYFKFEAAIDSTIIIELLFVVILDISAIWSCKQTNPPKINGQKFDLNDVHFVNGTSVHALRFW